MEDHYKILWEGGSGEVVEKKSRFIALTKPAESEEEALAFVESVRKQYWDARHHCYAYVIGETNQMKRYSDDGEPSQTAGRPILEVLLGAEVHNICAVVVRYFGGTLLGTGGLVRAYSRAAQEGLKNSKIIEKCSGLRITVATDYTGEGKLRHLFAQNRIPLLDSRYTDQVVLTALLPLPQAEYIKAQLMEATNGKAIVEEESDLCYGIAEGELVIF